jgi:acetyl esterase
MALLPQVVRVLDEYARRGGAPTHELSPDEARHKYASDPDFAGPPEPVARVWDDVIAVPEGALQARFYRPHGSASLPVLVYFHGGGWVCGGIAYVDPPLRYIANRSRCGVVSVDYRLAPENPFPAAPEDALAAARWVHRCANDLGYDPGRVAVGGDSAGGNLAAVAALMARDRAGPPLAYQVLIYPVTDYTFDTPSYCDNAEGYLLTRESMKWYWGHYLTRPEEGANPYASPLRAALEGLPSASLFTAEYDPLRDEGEQYARRLQAAGVPVRLRRYGGLVHGFFRMGGAVDQARRALDDIAADLGTALA